MGMNSFYKAHKSMRLKIYPLLAGLLIVMLLAACQPSGRATQTGFNSSQGGFSGTPGAFNGGQGRFNGTQGGQFAANPQMETQIASNPDLQTRIASGGGFGRSRGTPSPTVEVLPTGTPVPSPTATPPTAGAVQTVQDYFAALEKGDFAGASKLVSAFSLMANKITAGDVADALVLQKQAGAAWSDLQIKDSQVFNENTILVHVTYQLAAKDAKTGEATQSEQDELWPLREENHRWLYNWSNIIDFKTLGDQYKQTGGLTITPLQLTRYSDRIRLTVLAQNGTNEAIVIGTPNQTLATFHFGSQSVDAVNTRYIFDRLRGYPDVAIDVMGLYTSYPDSVDIVKWKTVNVPPWYSFALGG